MWCRPRHRKVNRHAGVYMAGCYCRIVDICAEFWSGRATRWGYFGAHVATESIQNKTENGDLVHGRINATAGSILAYDSSA